jgi:hypothetical protein
VISSATYRDGEPQQLKLVMLTVMMVIVTSTEEWMKEEEYGVGKGCRKEGVAVWWRKEEGRQLKEVYKAGY